MDDVILKLVRLRKAFTDGRAVQALESFSGEVRAGEILGVVGESGSGKSTLARLVMRLIDADEGEIWLCGREIGRLRGAALRRCYGQMQMVFQDAAGSFDPRLPVGRSIAELLENFTDLRDLTEENLRSMIDRAVAQAGHPEVQAKAVEQLQALEGGNVAVARRLLEK